MRLRLHPGPIEQTIRRKGYFTLLTGVLYGAVALIIIGYLTLTYLFQLPVDRPSFLAPLSVFLPTMQAALLLVGSAWYIYAGLQLQSQPTYATTRTLLWVNLCISLLTLSGIVSIFLLGWTISILARLPAYRAWDARVRHTYSSANHTR